MAYTVHMSYTVHAIKTLLYNRISVYKLAGDIGSHRHGRGGELCQWAMPQTRDP